MLKFFEFNIQLFAHKKGQGSTSEWTYATDEVIINTVKAFRTQDPELLKTKEEIKVEKQNFLG